MGAQLTTTASEAAITSRNDGPPSWLVFRKSSRIAAAAANQPDQDLDNNLDGASGSHDPPDLDGLTADLSLTKRVDNETPRLGDLVTYTLTVLNSGPSTTTGVVGSIARSTITRSSGRTGPGNSRWMLP